MDEFTIKVMEKLVKARTLLEQVETPSCRCGIDDDPEGYQPCKCGEAKLRVQLNRILNILSLKEKPTYEGPI